MTGYAYDWRYFCTWCKEHQRVALPTSRDTITRFLTDHLRGGHKISSTRRRYHAIAFQHRRHGFEDWGHEDALLLLQGAQRLRGEKPRHVTPLTISQIRAMSEHLAGSSKRLAIRDRAILLMGFAAALRSASLASIALTDCEFVSEGLILTIPREKQDQEARGRYIGIPFGKHAETCTPSAVRAWIEMRGERCSGRLFLSRTHRGIAAKMIRVIVRRTLKQIGVNPRGYSAHSLRAGFITAAGEAGLSDLLIAEQTGHRDMDCLRGYLRRTNVFRANACAALNL